MSESTDEQLDTDINSAAAGEEPAPGAADVVASEMDSAVAAATGEVEVVANAAESAANAEDSDASIAAFQATNPSAQNVDNLRYVNKPAGTFVAPEPDGTVPAPAPGGAFYHFVKRLFDIVFSLLVCVILFIPTVVVCAAIAIESPGNPFFRQERVGQFGRPIYIWKLRTMVSDAHTAPEKYFTPEQLAVWQREQKVDNDPRITKIGLFLRRTSLDEVPQFINVLTGELSVIGPRPITLKETYEFGNARDEFLSCKPGITGWWQVTDRNDATWENHERQLSELFYVRHESFGLDLRIFWRTFSVMFVKQSGR